MNSFLQEKSAYFGKKQSRSACILCLSYFYPQPLDTSVRTFFPFIPVRMAHTSLILKDDTQLSKSDRETTMTAKNKHTNLSKYNKMFMNQGSDQRHSKRTMHLILGLLFEHQETFNSRLVYKSVHFTRKASTPLHSLAEINPLFNICEANEFLSLWISPT